MENKARSRILNKTDLSQIFPSFYQIKKAIVLLRLDAYDTLRQTACNQISAYLQSPAVELSDSDRRLCDGIVTLP